jgi:hypothetical protein
MKRYLFFILYRIYGLPIAIRGLFVRNPEVGPVGEIRRAYARQYWTVRTFGGIASIAIASLTWPVVIPVLAATATFRTGRVVRLAAKRSPGGQFLEQLLIWLQHGVPPRWYYVFELYKGPQRRNAGNYLTRSVTKNSIYQLLKRHYPPSSPLNDKAAFAERCRLSGLPIPETLFVASANRQITDSLIQLTDSSLFVKPLAGKGGKGAESWEVVQEGLFRNVATGAEMSASELLSQIQERSSVEPLIVQKRLENHSLIAGLNNGALATVRVLTMRNETGEPEIVGAVFRMGVGARGVVDNLHAGGIASCVALQTGELGRATNLGIGTSAAWFDSHPDTDVPIEGRRLPLWEDVCRLALDAHAAFQDRIIVGWDIALTGLGPVLVEGNGEPDLDIMQRPCGRAAGTSRIGSLLAVHLQRIRH